MKKLFFAFILLSGMALSATNLESMGSIPTKCKKTWENQPKHFYIDCGSSRDFDISKWRMHCYQNGTKYYCENFYTHWRYEANSDTDPGACEAACGKGATWQ